MGKVKSRSIFDHSLIQKVLVHNSGKHNISLGNTVSQSLGNITSGPDFAGSQCQSRLTKRPHKNKSVRFLSFLDCETMIHKL